MKLSESAFNPGRWNRLGMKLFVSYLVVVAAGMLVVLLAADLVAPTFFTNHMQAMTPGGTMSGMMGGSEVMDQTLTRAFQDALIEALLVAGGVAFIAAFAVSLFVTGRIVQPIRHLVQASRSIAAGHYAERVPSTTMDELGELATNFNAMAAELEATERRRQELIGNVAHELRTPVATLEGYLEGLLDGVIAPSDQTWAKLLDEAGRLRRLIADLQELSRAEAHQIPFTFETLDPHRLVQAAVERLAGQFEEKGLTFTIDLPAGLPTVRADRDRSIQVLTNLLTNALRYTPAPGSVRLSVRPVDGAVAFTVTDSGIGITPEHLPHLFERFYRVDKSRSRALGGSGIGLTIARALVEGMGGRIWATSAGIGQGATFGFTLPVA
jgi:signal transduction histidine kinase